MKYRTIYFLESPFFFAISRGMSAAKVEQ